MTVSILGKTIQLYEYEFIFVPIGTIMSYSIYSGCSFLVVRLLENTIYCHIRNNLGKSRCLANDTCALSVNEHLRHYLNGLLMAFRDSIMSLDYMRGKSEELIQLLYATYSASDCANFFSAMNSDNVIFSEFVRARWCEFENISEMAAQFDMTERRFARKFFKVFGMMPSQWLYKEKKRRLRDELLHGQKPLKVIAIDYNFATYSNFARYCTKTYGLTPKQMREDDGVLILENQL